MAGGVEQGDGERMRLAVGGPGLDHQGVGCETSGAGGRRGLPRVPAPGQVLGHGIGRGQERQGLRHRGVHPVEAIRGGDRPDRRGPMPLQLTPFAKLYSMQAGVIGQGLDAMLEPAAIEIAARSVEGAMGVAGGIGAFGAMLAPDNLASPSQEPLGGGKGAGHVLRQRQLGAPTVGGNGLLHPPTDSPTRLRFD